MNPITKSNSDHFKHYSKTLAQPPLHKALPPDEDDDDEFVPSLAFRPYIDSSDDESDLETNNRDTDESDDDDSPEHDDSHVAASLPATLNPFSDDHIDIYIQHFLETNDPDKPLNEPSPPVPLTNKFFLGINAHTPDTSTSNPVYPSQAFQEFLDRYDSDNEDDDNDKENAPNATTLSNDGNTPSPSSPCQTSAAPSKKITSKTSSSSKSSKNHNAKKRRPIIESTNQKKKKIQRQTPKKEAKRKGLPMGLFNLKDARSNSLQMVIQMLQSQGLHFGPITETKFPETKPIHARKYKGYKVYATYTTHINQGGVAFIFDPNVKNWFLEFFVCHGPNVLSCVLVSGDQRTLLIGAYLPPNSLADLAYLEEALQRYPKYTPILMGDLNIDLSKTNHHAQEITNLLSVRGLMDLLPHFTQ